MNPEQNDELHRKQGGSDKVQIGPRIDRGLWGRVKAYAFNCGVNSEKVVEVALFELMKGKDLTPVVQLTLSMDIETDYNDPRYEPLKALLDIARSTNPNEKGRVSLIERINKGYVVLRNIVRIDARLAVEVQAVLSLLQEGLPKLLEE